MKVLLVGEFNPYGSNGLHALWPDPAHCAGWRLCHEVLEMTKREYLRSFERTNLLAGTQWRDRWSAPAARDAADRIRWARRDWAVVMLGAKVSAAFGLGRLAPFGVEADPHFGVTFARLPHPSGRCREWNDPAAGPRARELVRELLGRAAA